MKIYQDAADSFSLEPNNTSNTNACLLKVVDIGLFVAAPDFGAMIKILETVADKYMQSKLTAPSAKELYFKAILLYLANDDAIGADQAMKRYLNNDPTFLQTRQQKFAQAIITSVKEQNLELFSNEW
jgi:alpha-soluble NSF attachment protein